MGTEHGYLRVSTAEATAFDLVAYIGQAGGLDNVATVLAELGGQLDPKDLERLARTHVSMAAVQRMGFLLELTGHAAAAEPLAAYVACKRPPVAPLRPGRSLRGACRNHRWRLAVNTRVEAEI